MKKGVMTIGITTYPSWISSIKEYIENINLPQDPSKVTLVKKRENKYTIAGGTQYKRGLSTPLLRCLGK